MGKDDSPRLHAFDTQRAGAGISDETLVEILARDAPARIEELLELGAAFDRTDSGELALGREAAHQRRRIVKAGGDATGHEILKTLIAAVHAQSPIITWSKTSLPTISFCATGGCAAFTLHDNATATRTRTSPTRWSSRPAASAASIDTRPIRSKRPATASRWRRARARCSPTWSSCSFIRRLWPSARDPMPLVTEAVRGEGAILRQRFRRTLHARRSIPTPNLRRATSSRARSSDSCSAGAPSVSTRARPSAQHFPPNFQPCSRFCASAGIDPRVRNIPVAPAAHYHMGGIAVDEWGRSYAARLVGVRRNQRHRRARREPPGQQLAARSARVRHARRDRTSPQRDRDRAPPMCLRGAPRAARSRSTSGEAQAMLRLAQRDVRQRRPGAQRKRAARSARAHRGARRQFSAARR